MAHAAQMASAAQRAAQRFSHVGEPPLASRRWRFSCGMGAALGILLSCRAPFEAFFAVCGGASRSVFRDAAVISVAQIRKCADK